MPGHPRAFPQRTASLVLLLAFLSSLQLAQPKLTNRARDKIHLKPKPRVDEGVPDSYDGLPADHEYDVDLSDQGGTGGQGGGEVEEGPDPVQRSLEWLRKLMMGEDLADRLDDLICAWDKVVGTDLDTVVLLLLGWLGFGGVIFVVSHFIYSTIGSTDEASTVSLAHPAPIPPFQANIAHPGPQPTNYSVQLNGLATSNGRSSSRSPLPHSNLPQAVGSDQETVDYVNSCWRFLYSDSSVRAEIQSIWLEKLNEFAKRSSLDDGLLVEFTSLLEETTPPAFSNMTAESCPSENMTITCDIAASISFLLRTSRPIRESIETADYILHVDRLRGRFSITVINTEHLVIAKLEGWPDIKMRLSKAGAQISQVDKEEQSLAAVVEEVAVQAIRGVQLDLRTDSLRGFPMFVRKVFPDNNQKTSKLSNPNFSRGGSRPNSSSSKPVNGIGSGPVHSSRQLDVKIVKAVQLGGAGGKCLEPYVVLEVDEPSQRKQTRTGSGAQFGWDETFPIDITVHSSELLFEVWDQGQKIGKSDAFMGLGIVAVAELMVTASQRHVIPLQGRPYEEDQVTGLLTIEFLFQDGHTTFEEAELMPGVNRTFEAAHSLTHNGHSLMNKKTTYTNDQRNGSDVADMALRDIEINRSRGLGNGQPPSKSTLVIHQVQRPHRSSSRSTQERPVSSTSNSGDEASGSIGTTSITSKDSDIPADYRRGRMRKRNFISSIKKRFSGTRSLSSGLDPTEAEQNKQYGAASQGDSRTSSLDRVRSVSEHRPEALAGRPTSLLHLPAAEDASSMSDVSNISNFSTASNKTFVTEESSLVLETLEEGRHHHYLIPLQAARRGRFKKKGTKLHIFMDHIFVARHIKLGSACQVCNLLIPLRLGKQAYVCRDCGLTCHKPCHIRVEGHCDQTSLPNMELYRGSSIVKIPRLNHLRKRLRPKSRGSSLSLAEHHRIKPHPRMKARQTSATTSPQPSPPELVQSQSIDDTASTTKLKVLRIKKNFFRKKR